MIYKETVKKIKHEMLLTKEDFIKLLDFSFTFVNNLEGNYNHILKNKA